MSRIYGYARTSTQQQKLGLEDQIQKLKEAGCRTVFNERISSRKSACDSLCFFEYREEEWPQPD